VFAFTYLLGINLMPWIRNRQDLKLYKIDPTRSTSTSTGCSLTPWTGTWLITFHWRTWCRSRCQSRPAQFPCRSFCAGSALKAAATTN